MNDIASKLFDKSGYISLKEYVADIGDMRKNGSWKLPLRMGDRLHLRFLSVVARFSWFSDALFIMHPHIWSPAYSVILSYLRKNDLFDSVFEKDLRHSGYFSYFFKKNITRDGYVSAMTGQGIAQDKATAFSKALGEMIERMISGLGDMNESILIASPDEVLRKYRALYPPKHHRFLEIQKKKYPELRHNPSDSIEWVRGVDLIAKEEIYIPKQITSWFIGARTPGEKFLNPTSNGCAGYFTKTGATLRGLFESIHRDAFLVHWLTMIVPRVIIEDSLPEEIRKRIQGFKSLGTSLYILDVTSLPIPSVYIVAINEESQVPRVVLSGASALTFEKAISDALVEMAMMISGLSYVNDEALTEDVSDTIEPFISDFNKTTRQSYWRGKEKIRQFQWFISGEKVSYDEVSKQDMVCDDNDSSRLRACLEALKKIGDDYCPIVYYPKNSIQEELGFYVAQVYIPKAFPLYLREYLGTFDSDRLQEFASSKGISEWTLNPFPHMFS